MTRLPAHHRRRRIFLTASLGFTAITAACGIGVRRDYSTIPAGQVGFDDLCGLQDYFDTIEAKLASPPGLVNAVDIESQSDQRIQGGKNRFLFETDFELKQLRRVLQENWNRLPDQLAKADRVELEVHWSAKAGVRRVVTDSEPELIIGRESFMLPYHVCLSELLFGAPLYRQRREMSGRPLPYKALFADGGLKVDLTDAAAASPPASAPAGAPPAPTAAPPAPAPAAKPAPASPAAPPASGVASRDGGATPPASPVFKPAPAAQ